MITGHGYIARVICMLWSILEIYHKVAPHISIGNLFFMHFDPVEASDQHLEKKPALKALYSIFCAFAIHFPPHLKVFNIITFVYSKTNVKYEISIKNWVEPCIFQLFSVTFVFGRFSPTLPQEYY